MKERMDQLREKSGNVSREGKLISFLYELMRDHLPVGVVEGIVANCNTELTTDYTNGWLAKYAEDLADLLQIPNDAREQEETTKCMAEQIEGILDEEGRCNGNLQVKLIKDTERQQTTKEGIFRRAPYELNIDDNDVLFMTNDDQAKNEKQAANKYQDDVESKQDTLNEVAADDVVKNIVESINKISLITTNPTLKEFAKIFKQEIDAEFKKE